jgi:hypothetical protein
MAETTSNVEIAHHTHESGKKGAGTCVGTEIAPKPLRRAPDGQRRRKVVPKRSRLTSWYVTRP